MMENTSFGNPGNTFQSWCIPGKRPDLMAGNPGWPRNGLLGGPTKGLGGPPVPAPFRWIGAVVPVLWRALARSSKNISSCELADCPPPPPGDYDDDNDSDGNGDDDDDDGGGDGHGDDDVGGDRDDTGDDDGGDEDDEKGDDGEPAVWENGFKPPPDSSFMFLK